MRVRIRDVWYDSEKEPIMLDLTDADKANLQKMVPPAFTFITMPAHLADFDLEKLLNRETKEAV